MDPREYCFWCMQPLPSRDAKCPACGRENRVRKNGDDQLPFALLARKYVVGHALGRGGFGITYVGMNEQLARRVAIKEYYPDGIAARSADRIHLEPAAPEYDALFREGRSKALEEARTIASIQSVPHVVRIFDCFGRNNTVYIVMEFIEGESLAERVEQKGKFSWEEAWRLMRPIGEALGILHRQGLVHRDISPDNIMISRSNGESILLDFGAASAQIGSGERHEKVMKDGYAPPELYQEYGAINGRTDEYAWAATFLYLLTGKRPGNALQRQYGGEDDLWKSLRRVASPEAQQAFRRAMELDPEARYPGMDELLEALEVPSKGDSPGRLALKIGAGAAALCMVGSVILGLVGG